VYTERLLSAYNFIFATVFLSAAQEQLRVIHEIFRHIAA